MASQSNPNLRALLDEALMSADYAWWQWDIPRNRVTFNDLKVTWLGYDAEDFRDVGYEAFTDLLHPDDYERTMQAMRDYLEGRARLYEIDYRILRADGEYTWFMDRGCALESAPDGKPLVLRGLVIDLGEETRERVRDEIFLAQIREALFPYHAEGAACVCVVCKKMKIENTNWIDVDRRFHRAFHGELSHGICPVCVRRLYPDQADAILEE